jgi:hypothetical protein
LTSIRASSQTVTAHELGAPTPVETVEVHTEWVSQRELAREKKTAVSKKFADDERVSGVSLTAGENWLGRSKEMVVEIEVVGEERPSHPGAVSREERRSDLSVPVRFVHDNDSPDTHCDPYGENDTLNPSLADPGGKNPSRDDAIVRGGYGLTPNDPDLLNEGTIGTVVFDNNGHKYFTAAWHVIEAAPDSTYCLGEYPYDWTDKMETGNKFGEFLQVYPSHDTAILKPADTREVANAYGEVRRSGHDPADVEVAGYLDATDIDLLMTLLDNEYPLWKSGARTGDSYGGICRVGSNAHPDSSDISNDVDAIKVDAEDASGDSGSPIYFLSTDGEALIASPALSGSPTYGATAYSLINNTGFDYSFTDPTVN